MKKKHGIQQVRKGIITCGGYATRFLPISKAVPKEMLPIGDKPVIHYIVEELGKAGITDILILLGRGKEAIPNYFDRNHEMDIPEPFPNINIIYKRVPMPLGSADCVLHARNFVQDEPFVIAYGDDVFFGSNATKELIDDFQTHNKPVITTFRVLPRHTPTYGIISGKDGNVTTIIEKPKSNPPSLLAAVGRYLMTPQIFELISQDVNQDGEICMTRNLNKLATAGNLRYVKTASARFDTGNPRGLYLANRHYFKEV